MVENFDEWLLIRQGVSWQSFSLNINVSPLKPTMNFCDCFIHPCQTIWKVMFITSHKEIKMRGLITQMHMGTNIPDSLYFRTLVINIYSTNYH